MNNVLTLVPVKYRKIAYVVVSIAATLYAIWQGVDGDWRQFATAVVTAAVTALAQANTKAPVTIASVTPVIGVAGDPLAHVVLSNGVEGHFLATSTTPPVTPTP